MGLSLTCLIVPALWVSLQAPETPPPGLVLVSGGRTTIGSSIKDIEALVKARNELSNSVASETPMHTLSVASFHLMPTEVTNEQYNEYILATQSKPPRSWGIKALQAGQAEFLEDQGRAKQEAKASGKPFEAQVFDPELWWETHWKDVRWEIPSTELAHPVVFVTYFEAQAYARWAGLRLMTEFEFQRAARQDSEHLYPWGDDWDDSKYCQSLHSGKDLAAPVGSYPKGAVGGIHDLAGNVWEWTSSPFSAYPGYEALRFTTKNRVLECLAPFDPNQQVTVSGSFQMDRIGVRLATRRNADRDQSTNALGFRCAASPAPGTDAARWIVAQDLGPIVLGSPVEFAPDSAVVLRQWTSVPGTAAVEGYAVIRSYQHALACPRTNLRASTLRDLRQLAAQTGPLVLGFVDLRRPTGAPALDGGTYLVAWLGAGSPVTVGKAEDAGLTSGDAGSVSLQSVPGFRENQDSYIFYGLDGEPVLALEAPPVRVEKLRGCSLAVEPHAPPPEAPPAGTPAGGPMDTLRISLAVPSAGTHSKCFVFDLSLQVDPGTYDASWR